MKKGLKILSAFFAIQIISSIFFSPSVEAKTSAVTIESLVDPQTISYRSSIVQDNPTYYGSHHEIGMIAYSNYLLNICQSVPNYDANGSSSGSATTKAQRVNAFKYDPTLCYNLDSSVNFNDGSGSKSMSNYDFFMKAEGYRAGTSLINDDMQKGNVGKFTNQTNNDFETQKDSSAFMALTFPSTDKAPDVTSLESDRAINVSNTLTTNLNSMLSYINGGLSYKSVTELINKSILIRPTTYGYTILNENNKTNKGYAIFWGTLKNNRYVVEDTSKSLSSYASKFKGAASNFWNATGLPNVDKEGNLLAYALPITKADASYGGLNLTDLDTSNIASFVWAMPKGYVKIPNTQLNFDNGGQERDYIKNDSNDIPWITIHHLSMYANNAYKNRGISISTSKNDQDNGDWLGTLIANLFQKLFNQLRTILGLNDAYTLIYNKGVRNSYSYNYGAMPDSWWSLVVRYNIIFQSIAWFIIICGVIKMLIDMNVSTIKSNPGRVASVYQTISSYLVAGLLLVTVIPLTQFLLSINASIVGVFASQVDPNAVSPPIFGGLAGIILQFCYFAIIIWLNFTYIMRGIAIAILTILSPIFISSLTFSQKHSYFEGYVKELLANIFMQSIHAFSFAFLTNLVNSGNGFENLVVSYSIIPITALARGLIFGSAGSSTINLGKTAAMRATNVASGALNSVSNKLENKGNAALAGENGESEDKGGAGGGKGGGKSGPGGGGSDLASNTRQRMRERMNAISDEAQKGNKAGQARAKGAAALSALGAAAATAGGLAKNIGAATQNMVQDQLSGGEDVRAMRGLGENAVDSAESAGTLGVDAAVAGGKAASFAGSAVGNRISAAAGAKKGLEPSYAQQSADAKQFEKRPHTIRSAIRDGHFVGYYKGGGGSWSMDKKSGDMKRTMNMQEFESMSQTPGVAETYSKLKHDIVDNNQSSSSAIDGGAEISARKLNNDKVEVSVPKAFFDNKGITSYEPFKDGKGFTYHLGSAANRSKNVKNANKGKYTSNDIPELNI